MLAGVAQLVEQLICNQQVVGSNPIASSICDGEKCFILQLDSLLEVELLREDLFYIPTF